MRIENVRILTMDAAGTVIGNGYVEFENGIITGIGDCVGGEVRGVLCPGFIDGHTHLGIIGDSLGFESDDCNETTDPVTPQLRALDAINPLDRNFSDARNAGVTTVAVAPGSANPIGGQVCVIKTSGRRVDRMTLLEPAAMKMALGENPKGVYHDKDDTPETRMATAALIRENLFKAVKYADAMDAAHPANPAEDEDIPDEPDFDMKLEALIPVVRGKLPVHFHAHRADDIFTAVRIAKEFGLKYTIIHCTEGGIVADELAEDGITAFLGPDLRDRCKPELSGQSSENPPRPAAAGVKYGITTDSPETPIRYLTLCAAMAVKNGLDSCTALRSITCDAADILGVSGRVGSIECGKDADMVMLSGDPLDLTSAVLNVWIDGKAVK